MQSPGCLSAAETGAVWRQAGRRQFAARLGKLSYFCRADIAGCQDQQGEAYTFQNNSTSLSVSLQHLSILQSFLWCGRMAVTFQLKPL